MTAPACWAALLLAGIALAAGCSGDGAADAPGAVLTPGAPAAVEPSSDEKLDLALQVFVDRYGATAGAAAAGSDHAFLYLVCAAAPASLHRGRCNDGPYGDHSWAGSFVVEVMYLRALDFEARGGLRVASPPLAALVSAVSRMLPDCSPRMVLCNGDFLTIQEGVVYFGARLEAYFVAAISREIDVAMREEDAKAAVATRLRALRTEHAELLSRMSDAFDVLREHDELSALGAGLGPGIIVNAAVRVREELIRDALRGHFAAQEADAIYARSLGGG